MTPKTLKITVFHPAALGTPPVKIEAGYGSVLREVLLANHQSPYREKNRLLNCRGLGICGTCQVVVREAATKIRQRSCQIRCFRDLEIELE